MKLTIGILINIFILITTGCASMYTPESSLIDTLPVIKIGEKELEGKEYILHIPAHTEFPVHFTVNGDLISLPVDQAPNTRIRKDLYVYKYWSSLDGRNWQPSRDLINMPIEIGMGPDGGQVNVKVDLTTK